MNGSKTRLFGLLACLSVHTAAAADRVCPIATCDPALIGFRSVRAERAIGGLRVDGRLEEEAWHRAAPLTGFIQSRPVPGAASRLETRAFVLVGDDALYVAVRASDPDPQRIVAPYLRRDNEGQSDWIFVEVDSRRDRRSAFSFGLNPRGVQVDGVFFDDVNYDVEWNGIWQGAARVDAQGWTAEFRIPFSQLAFSDAVAGHETSWGLNVYRYSPHHGESSNWSPRFQGLPGCVSQFNELKLTVPRAPHRLEVAPFVAPRLQSGGVHESSVTGGADFTIGLGPAFTLTGTVLPDFGQVEADPSQINLTTFELFQAERRPFFVEGASAFAYNAGLNFVTRGNSFAEETPFYSRRVGRDGARILGAVKLAGRTRSGWTIGLFSAASGRRLEEDGPDRSRRALVLPATGTTLFRAVRSLRGGDSAFGFIAGRVDHRGLRSTGPFADAATTIGFDGRHRFAGQRHEVSGWVLGSRVEGSPTALSSIARAPRHGFQRPDATPQGSRPIGNSLTGAAAQVRLAGISGAFVWGIAGELITPGFEVNDLGFQRNADWQILKGDWRYQRQTPARLVRRWTIGSDNLGIGWTTAGALRAREIDASVRAEFRSYWDTTIAWRRDLPALSTEWLRGGPALLLPSRDTVHAVVNSDTRRSSSITLDGTLSIEPASSSRAVTLAPQLTWRASDRLEWTLGPSYSDETVGWQFVSGPATGSEDHIVGRLRQQTASLLTRADLIVNVHTSLQFVLQPFVSTGRYDRFQRLVDPRAARPASRFAALAGTSVDPPDGVEHALNATLVFRWEYRPSSFLTVVWNRRQDAVSRGRQSLADAVRDFTSAGGPNVFLVKTSLRLGR